MLRTIKPKAHKDPPSMKPCWFWLGIEGSCPDGALCKFSHEDHRCDRPDPISIKVPNEKGGLKGVDQFVTDRVDASNNRNSSHGLRASKSNCEGGPEIQKLVQGTKLAKLCRFCSSTTCIGGIRCLLLSNGKLPDTTAPKANDTPSSSSGRLEAGKKKSRDVDSSKPVERLTEEQQKRMLEKRKNIEAEKQRLREEQQKQILEERKIKEGENRRLRELFEEDKRRKADEKRQQEQEEWYRKEQERKRREEERKAREQEGKKREEEWRRKEEERLAEALRKKEALEIERGLAIQAAKEMGWREEAKVTQRIAVGESSLITCAAGLDIRHFVAGFDLCRIKIKNLPLTTTKDDLSGLLIGLGQAPNDFFVSEIKRPRLTSKLEAIALVSSARGEAIALSLDGLEFRGEILTVQLCKTVLHARQSEPHHYSCLIPSRQYAAQQLQWDTLSERVPERKAWIHVQAADKPDSMLVRVFGEDETAAGALKVRAEGLVAGETLDATQWHSSFLTLAGRKFFDRINHEAKVHVRSDFETRTLKIFGEPEGIAAARTMIQEEIEHKTAEEMVWTLDRRAVGFFVRVGLGQLKELVGDDNVSLQLACRPARITVKGGETAEHHLRRLLEESRRTSDVAVGGGGNADGALCPVCYTEPTSPEQLGCGHTYCAGCLQHFLTSAGETKTFPLLCTGNEAKCSTPISLPFMRRFLSARTFEHLVDVAFASYIERHPQELKYCTTPDCKQVYRHQQPAQNIHCPSCLKTVCSACDDDPHKNMTCDESRLHRNPAERDRRNEEFMARIGYKKCPRCSFWIEKNGGCNHMSCRCGGQFNWG